MDTFARKFLTHPAVLVIVVGDVTSTMTCTIVARQLRNIVAPVEADKPSFGMTMPQEINKMVTDSILDYFLRLLN